MMKIYTRNNKPDPNPENIEVSQDVIVYTEDGLLNIGFFDYLNEKWSFHTDTLIDMDETGDDGKPVQFNWMYAPEELINPVKPKRDKNRIGGHGPSNTPKKKRRKK